jgi:hypothetical protein
MNALMLAISAFLFIGALTLAFMTAIAFAGHPSDQFVWVVSKWRAIFNNDPNASIEIFAISFLVSFAMFGGGLALAVNLWVSRRRRWS